MIPFGSIQFDSHGGGGGVLQGDDFEHTIRILLLGDSGVGKTSLMTRFSEDKFAPTMISTAGVDFKVRYPGQGYLQWPTRLVSIHPFKASLSDYTVVAMDASTYA